MIIQEEVQTLITNYHKFKKIHAEMERDIKRYFRICQECKGKGGVRKNIPLDRWQDCFNCDGRGLIEKHKRRK